MTNYIAQSTFSAAVYTISELIDMVTAVNGEQFEINTNRVDKLIDQLQPDGTVLHMPIEVSLLGDVRILTGGRHRLEALKELYDHSTSVRVIQFECLDASEVALRTVHNNGSRNCTKAEATALKTAAKYGFGTVDIDSLRSLLYGNDGKALNVLPVTEQLSTLATILALTIRNDYNLDVNLEPTIEMDTAEKLAGSILTQVKKMTRLVEYTTIIPPSVDKKGKEIGEGSVSSFGKVKTLVEVLATSDNLELLLNTMLAVMTRATTKGVQVPLGVYQSATIHEHGKTCLGRSEIISTESGTCYHAVVNLAKNVTRGAAQYAALISTELASDMVEGLT